MNLEKGISDYWDYFTGKIHFKNKNYREAKLYFSNFIFRSESKMNNPNCGWFDSSPFITEEAHFFRAIANFYLGDFYDQNGFYIDTQYLESLNPLSGSNPFFLSFLKVLWITKNGNHLTLYDSAINIISQCLASNPEALDDFVKFQIHLPLKFQVVFKMYFF